MVNTSNYYEIKLFKPDVNELTDGLMIQEASVATFTS